MRFAILALASFLFTGCAGADGTPLVRNANDHFPTQTLESTSQIIETDRSVPYPTPPHYEEIFEDAFRFLRMNYYSRDPNDIDWNLLDSRFRPRVSKAITQDEFWQVLLDLVREIDDPHTFFLPGSVYSSRQSRFARQGTEGVGIQTRPIRAESFLYVWDVCPQSPAARSGIEKGDAIIRVNGHEVSPTPSTIKEFLALDEAINQLWSPSDTDIEIAFVSPASSQSQTVILESTRLNSCGLFNTGVLSTNPRIGYIGVPQGRTAGMQHELQTRLEELEGEGKLDGLVYDVRRSSAGFAELFMTGLLGYVESGSNGRQIRSAIRSRGTDTWGTDALLVILIDHGTVSAGEVMALSLQASGRATIIGTESRGGLGQGCSHTLADGSLLGVRCGIFVLPDGTSMEDKKVSPDIYVEMGRSGLSETPDPQLDAALDHLLSELDAGVH